MIETHPERVCQQCHRENVCWYTDNELWNKVIGSPNGILCLNCFCEIAEKTLKIEPIWQLTSLG